MSTYLPIYCFFCKIQLGTANRALQKWLINIYSVIEWFCFIHYTITGNRFFSVSEHKMMRLVWCQMLHIYLSKVHSQIQHCYSSHKISINSLHIQLKVTSNKIHTYSSMSKVYSAVHLVLQFQVLIPNSPFSIPNI